VLITLALVTGGYALAQHLHISGPLAMVMAGIVVGNQGRQLGMSEHTRAHLDPFWVVVDEVLNALLFLLIGLEVLIVEVTPQLFVVGLVAIPVVLVARLISVGGAVSVIRLKAGYPTGTVRMMTWGGLRGGIAIALALSLPADATRDTIVYMTYAVVVFSMLVQGLTVGRLAKRQFAA
jgi:CPA1 family monovalent cation:H+ antiporter